MARAIESEKEALEWIEGIVTDLPDNEIELIGFDLTE